MSTGDRTEIHLQWPRPVGITLSVWHADVLTAEDLRALVGVVENIEYFRAVITDPEIAEVEA